jgi:hypothetical protein
MSIWMRAFPQKIESKGGNMTGSSVILQEPEDDQCWSKNVM